MLNFAYWHATKKEGDGGLQMSDSIILKFFHHYNIFPAQLAPHKTSVTSGLGNSFPARHK